jgi:hypothetical protein
MIETCEYVSIVKHAGQEGWLDQLVAAHAAPCTKDQAFKILALMPNLPTLKVLLRAGSKGRARISRRGEEYGITLPTEPGGRWGRLRAGIVLHEAAHILAHQAIGRFDHQEKFCRTLRRLLHTDWRDQMPTSSRATTFHRHRAQSFSLNLIREIDHGGKRGKEQISEHLPGPFTAEEAHEEGRMLVNDPRENVKAAFVFGNTEGAYIGVIYERGEVYLPWAEEVAAAGDVRGLTTKEIVDEVASPVIELSPADSAAFAEAIVNPAPPNEALKDAAARTDWQKIGTEAVTPKAPKAAPKVPRRAGLALTVAPGSEAKWPPAASAQYIRATFEARGAMTAKEAAEVLAPKLVELGVAHPASAVSRLKQAGLLQEVAA